MLNNDAKKLLKKPWRNFFDKFNQIDDLKINLWKEIHLLAYLCKRYEDFYKIPFAFSFKGAPLKCSEIVMIKKTYAALGTTNPYKVKSYIDWIFDKKIIPKNMKIKTLAFFTTQGLGNEFNQMWAELNTIKKTTEVPNDYKEMGSKLDLAINTYGDLAFIVSALTEDSLSESRQPYVHLMNQLSAIGFDKTILKDMK